MTTEALFLILISATANNLCQGLHQILSRGLCTRGRPLCVLKVITIRLHFLVWQSFEADRTESQKMYPLSSNAMFVLPARKHKRLHSIFIQTCTLTPRKSYLVVKQIVAHRVSFRLILMFSTHLSPCLTSRLLLLPSPNKILYPLLCVMSTTFLAHLILLEFIVLIIFGKEYKL